ncbi:hypothetical protein BGX21_005575, partial [Mortierella sp. AD011]
SDNRHRDDFLTASNHPATILVVKDASRYKGHMPHLQAMPTQQRRPDNDETPSLIPHHRAFPEMGINLVGRCPTTKNGNR